MRHVSENPEQAVQKGKQARVDMVTKYSEAVIGEVLHNHLLRITERLAKENNDTNRGDKNEL